jgi:hypothetical protein
MKFTGIVTKVGETITGTSAKGEWSKTSVIIEERNGGEYPDTVCLDVFNKPKELEKLKVGEVVEVEYNGKVNEYNGKYYNSLNVWKVTVIGETKAQAQTETEKPTDDLPF